MYARRSLMVAVLGLLACGSANASDGVLEINQACATTTGCFAGDVPGLPVTITPAAPARSFRLTGDLTTASGNQTMISVSAPSVTVDLGGFRIAGPNVCSGTPVSSCSAPGSGVGVSGGNDVTVKNGAIAGVGGAAVSLTYSARVEGLSIFHCGGGIIATDLAVVRGNIVTSTGGDGIHCRDHCVVSENSATGHLGDGIEVRTGAVHDNAASLNGGSGANLLVAGTFGGNQFSGNAAPDVSGGHASGGNACEDRSCSPRAARRYYLSNSASRGNLALTACAPGFHFASFWEIFDFGSLEYDELVGIAAADGGGGPPSAVPGWVRTGGIFDDNGQAAGKSNCSLWTTTSGYGSVAYLDDGWDSSISRKFPPWGTGWHLCNSFAFVWCVED
jgi:hypothetical protein